MNAPGLNTIGGHADRDSEISELNRGNEGNALPNVAENSADIWLTYDAIEDDDSRFTAGGGVFYQDDRFVNRDNTRILSSRSAVDLMAEYETQPLDGRALRARAGIRNLFDEQNCG